MSALPRKCVGKTAQIAELSKSFNEREKESRAKPGNILEGTFSRSLQFSNSRGITHIKTIPLDMLSGEVNGAAAPFCLLRFFSRKFRQPPLKIGMLLIARAIKKQTIPFYVLQTIMGDAFKNRFLTTHLYHCRMLYKRKECPKNSPYKS